MSATQMLNRVRLCGQQTKVCYNDGKFTVEYGDDQKTHTIEAEQLLVATGVQVCCTAPTIGLSK
jgi:pyruvate/2-oxoglutarate dehydrogenase complex dihydrolipoamide dehydrogenase (E3) component